MGSSRISGTSTTRRSAVAAAGLGMVLASFAGAASAGAATHPRPARAHLTPHIVTPTAGLTASATPVQIPATTLAGGASAALPAVTITDPGILASGQTVTLDLLSGGNNVTLDYSAVPTVSATGATISGVSVLSGSVSFTVTKPSTATDAVYVVGGMKLVGTSDVASGAFGMNVTTSGTPPQPGVATFDLGAVTHLVPAAYGPTAPDTAATVFDATFNSEQSAVLASDYEPQDAESANYLVAGLR